eukprot:5881818-Heterocapsa_arctica.AAC.1
MGEGKGRKGPQDVECSTPRRRTAQDPSTEEPGNQSKKGESRKRSRPLAREIVQEPVPMEVDQEGEHVQEPGENHGAEQEGQATANHHQHEDPPVEGWNHEA